MQHSKALDGLRGVAVLLVMLFHFGYLPVGWIGVQAFFVLSGYLITDILLRSRSQQLLKYLGVFYWNRTLRIFPLFYLFLAFLTVAYLLFGAPSSFIVDWPWLISYTANFARMRSVDLGGTYVHIWSLAVEQQFYILWPMLVFLVPLRIFRFVVVAILILTPLFRLAMFALLMHAGHSEEFAGKAVYVFPVAQFDAFAAGAAIPLWELSRLRSPGRYFLLACMMTGIAGFAVLVSAYIGGRGAFVASLGYAMYLLPGYGYVWGYTLLNIVFMLGIVCLLQDLWPTGILRSMALVWMGRISYGMYVYHLPLLILGAFLLSKIGIELRGPLRPAIFLVWFGSVIFVSDQSFRWFEEPLLKFKKRLDFSRQAILPLHASKPSKTN